MKNSMATRLITAALILLFVYTAAVKWADLKVFERELANQAIPVWSVPWLLWLIPLSETLVVILLFVPSSRVWGLYGSALLMSFFTGYMGLVLLNVFERVPCSCGGVLKSMDFPVHFFFNLFFLSLTLLAIRQTHRLPTSLHKPK